VALLENLSLLSGDVWENDKILIPGIRRFRSLERSKKHLGEQYDSLCTIILNNPISATGMHMQFGRFSARRLEGMCRGISCNLQDKRGKYMGVHMGCEDSVEATTSAWMASCDEETKTRQQAEDVIRQVSVASLYFLEHLFTCLDQAEERWRAREQAKYEADRWEFDIYRRMGPLKGYRFVLLLIIRCPMLILKCRSRSATFSIQAFKSTYSTVLLQQFSFTLRVYEFLHTRRFDNEFMHSDNGPN
jgi:hypothetical protein